MYSNKPLVPTTGNMAKEGINNMETTCNVLKAAITHKKEKNKIDIVNKKDKPHASKSK